jgi:hypothetical protein
MMKSEPARGTEYSSALAESDVEASLAVSSGSTEGVKSVVEVGTLKIVAKSSIR